MQTAATNLTAAAYEAVQQLADHNGDADNLFAH